MQDSRAASTLELVVNEQQLQNMSRVDLSQGLDDNRATFGNQDAGFRLNNFKTWPRKLRESFNTRIQDAKSKSETKTEFITEITRQFASTLMWFVCFVCVTIIPVILFFIGLINLDNCPSRPSLPYLVFATGFFMTASNIFNLALSLDIPILTNHRSLGVDIKNTICSIINIMFNCLVAFLYFICAYMVFTITKNQPESNNPNEKTEPECDSLLYKFTFWFVTLTLIGSTVLGLVAGTFFVYNRYRIAIVRGSTPRSPGPSTTTNSGSAASTLPPLRM